MIYDESLGGLPHLRESTPGLDLERSYRHEPAQEQAVSSRDPGRKWQEIGLMHTASRWIVREVELNEHVERVGCGEGIHKGIAVDRMDHVHVGAHRPRLLRLELADEVPRSVEAGEFAHLRLSILVPALAEVADAELIQLADEGRRVELGDNDSCEILGVATSRARGIPDLAGHASEALGESIHYFRKSGMSRSAPSSSSKLRSMGDVGGDIGSSAQAASAASAALPLDPATGSASGMT